jgi:hypothetical protein
MNSAPTIAIDGFPLSVEDPDYSIQLAIGDDLAAARSVLQRARVIPRPAEFYPQLVKSNSHEWLMPLLRRLRWNLDHGSGAPEWRAGIADMICQLLSTTSRLTEAGFLALAGEARGFHLPEAFPYLEHMHRLLGHIELDHINRSEPFGEPMSRALRTLAGMQEKICAGPRTFVWPLFRSDHCFAPGDPCWDARVRREIDTFDPALRTLWLEVFDAADTSLGGAGQPGRKCLAAMERLGEARLQAGLRRFLLLLADGTPLQLSSIGITIMRHVIVLVDKFAGRACDDFLYDIARAPWRRVQDVAWLPTYLWVLGRRPGDRAFACLEALAVNPVTSTAEVNSEYQSALQGFEREARGTGVDGYPLARDPGREPHHQRIDKILRLGSDAAAKAPRMHPIAALHTQALDSLKVDAITPAMQIWRAQMTAPRPWANPGPDAAASLETLTDSLFQDFSADLAGLSIALLERLEWIVAHAGEHSAETVKAWTQWIRGFGCAAGILQRCLARVDRLPLPWILASLRNIPGDIKVIDLCRRHVDENGWHVDLVEAIRGWISKLATSQSENVLRAKVEWFLWFEDVAPIRLEDCWSHRIKQDLRAMTAGERRAWLGLLQNAAFTITDRPTKKWLKPAEAAFPAVGAEPFRRRFAAWFEPFAGGQPLRMTVTGRNVLRLLIWTALIACDPAVDEALAGFAKARWKTKEVERRAAQAEMAFSYVLAERAPDAALPILESMVASRRAAPGTATYNTYLGLCARCGRSPIAQ